MFSASQIEFQWYLIRTARFRESDVAAQLGLFAGAEVYVPLVAVPIRCLRRGKPRVEPLFPGYVFARLNGAQLAALRRVQAFGSLVTFDGRPAIVDAAVIREMRRRERGRGYISLQVNRHVSRTAEPIRTVRDALPGIVGRFLRFEDGMQRISVLIGILNRKIILNLPAPASMSDGRTAYASYI